MRITIILLFLLITLAVNSQQKSQIKVQNQQMGCMALLPSNASLNAIDTVTARGLSDQYYLWDNGATLRVKFLSGSKSLHKKIMAVVHEWEVYANIKFINVDSGDAEIRVFMGYYEAHYSLIGQQSLALSQDQKTMNLDTTEFGNNTILRRTVLHEFGHAIGLLHEHYSPNSTIQWDKNAFYEDLLRMPSQWRNDLEMQFFKTYQISYTQGTNYDQKSIMHLPILARWTKNGFSVPWNNELSEGDKVLVGMLYPKNYQRSERVPRMSVNAFANVFMKENNEKDGLLFYPSFSINNRGSKGTAYFIVMFFDELGYPIIDVDDKYNVSNVVATYRSFNIPADTSLSVNKRTRSDLELYIPFGQLPPKRKDLRIKFYVYHIDAEEIKFIFSSPLISVN